MVQELNKISKRIFHTDYSQKKNGPMSIPTPRGDEYKGSVFLSNLLANQSAPSVKINKLTVLPQQSDNLREEYNLMIVSDDGRNILDVDSPSIDVQKAAFAQIAQIEDYNDMSLMELQIAAIRIDAESYDLIEDPTEEFQLALLKGTGYSSTMYFIKILNPRDIVIRAALNESGHNLIDVFDPIEEYMRIAFSQIAGIEEADHLSMLDLQSKAISKDASAYALVINPTEELNYKLIDLDPYNLRIISEPSNAIRMKAFAKIAQIKNYKGISLYELQLAATLRSFRERQGESAFNLIDSPSDSFIVDMLKNDGYTLKLIYKPSNDVLKIAFSQLSGFQNTTKSSLLSMQIKAVKKDPNTYHLIKSPTLAVQLSMVKEYSFSIDHIYKPSERLMLTAVNGNGFALGLIDNPTERVKKAAYANIAGIKDYTKHTLDELQKLAIKKNKKTIKLLEGTYIIDTEDKIVNTFGKNKIHIINNNSPANIHDDMIETKKITARKYAVFIVDVQTDNIDYPTHKEELDRIKDLIQSNIGSVPIYFIEYGGKQIHLLPSLMEATKEQLTLNKSENFDGDSNYYFIKYTNGAFATTDIDTFLKKEGVTDIILSGINQTECVESTAREALEHDYHIITAPNLIMDSFTEINPPSAEPVPGFYYDNGIVVEDLSQIQYLISNHLFF